MQALQIGESLNSVIETVNPKKQRFAMSRNLDFIGENGDSYEIQI